MDRNEIKHKFYSILKNQLCLDDNYFSRYSNDGENQLLVQDLKADAIDWYEILASIEDEFNIKIKNEKVEKCKTLYDFIELINNLI